MADITRLFVREGNSSRSSCEHVVLDPAYAANRNTFRDIRSLQTETECSLLCGRQQILDVLESVRSYENTRSTFRKLGPVDVQNAPVP